MPVESGGGGGGGDADKADIMVRLAQLEEKVERLEEEGKLKDREIFELRDRLEEEEFERKRVEDRFKDKLEEEGKKQEEEIRVLKEKVLELEKKEEGRQVVGAEDPRQEEARGERERYKGVILTDSNGRGTTEGTVKNHIPRKERGKFEIRVDDAAYTTGEALERVGVGEGKVDISGAIVVVDSLTNDIRGSRKVTPASPEELVHRVSRLRQGLFAAGAAAVVICEAKPMRDVDVSQHNRLLSEFLENSGAGGYGCRTQMRMNYLKMDGVHFRPEFGSILDRTYACAILGIHVPCPTPLEDFVPEFVRRRWEREWPRIGRGGPGRAPMF